MPTPMVLIKLEGHTVNVHINDVVITNAVYISELSRGDVVLLPVYGECIVMHISFDPAHNREFITIVLLCGDKELKLICARNMCFHYIGIDLGY